MSTSDTHVARCFCGAVELEISGQPEGMGYCHCASCREWSAGPVNAFSLWPKDAVKVRKGQDKLAHYAKHPRSVRYWCSTCGGHLFTEHPEWGLIDVFAAVIEDFEFAPGVHANYQETVLPMHDGLTKFRDFPEPLGGSGETIAE
ncbi:GFA family protein [Oleiagrimonas soli]|uniref:Aldehyde-activating protein n=1 Tax=Oleiagrimonas soli TaxID=1543381 RepID=A0A099CWD6_9GAMM|nr:GFA family protein [Oleiagrimonas soli]KGI78303.1 aldehyde-activating protein [Oleiagrimonas soli]MBB6183206.1 hypothetical protein [Oleiagrimonas soli]